MPLEDPMKPNAEWVHPMPSTAGLHLATLLELLELVQSGVSSF